eukprot:766983-Hanusia_phi.AAC.4
MEQRMKLRKGVLLLGCLDTIHLAISDVVHPTIFHYKSVLERIAKEKEIVLFIDLHGHSRKNNIFCYGCDR